MTITRLSNDGGETITLERFRGAFATEPEPAAGAGDDPDDLVRVGVVVDCETTGLNPPADRVISIGLRSFRFRRDTGALVGVGERYYALEDPGIPIPAIVTRITGLTDEDVRGQAIDWEAVRALIDAADVVIAHNASFDRAFIDPRIGHPRKVWLCTLDLLDWRGMGFPSAALEVLCVWHGFFVDNHHALEDAECLLHLLAHDAPDGDGAYLGRLLETGRRPTSRVRAWNSAYEQRHALKARGYRWDPKARVFWRDLPSEDEADEAAWLAEHIYEGPFRGDFVPVSPFARYGPDDDGAT